MNSTDPESGPSSENDCCSELNRLKLTSLNSTRLEPPHILCQCPSRTPILFVKISSPTTTRLKTEKVKKEISRATRTTSSTSSMWSSKGRKTDEMMREFPDVRVVRGHRAAPPNTKDVPRSSGLVIFSGFDERWHLRALGYDVGKKSSLQARVNDNGPSVEPEITGITTLRSQDRI